MTNCALNHVGVSVPDIEAAIEWYGKIFGFELIAGPDEFRPDGSHFGNLSSDICGDRYGGMRIAHMRTGDGGGFELFQFLQPEPERREDTMEYWKNGFFHIAITHEDVDGKVDEIVAAGGQKRSAIWDLQPGGDVRLCYCEDPYGNVIELMSRPYVQALTG